MRQHGSVLQGELWQFVDTSSSGQDEGAKETAQTVNRVRRGFVGDQGLMKEFKVQLMERMLGAEREPSDPRRPHAIC